MSTQFTTESETHSTICHLKTHFVYLKRKYSVQLAVHEQLNSTLIGHAITNNLQVL